MAVVDAREMVEEGMLQERGVVEVVHEEVEGSESNQGSQGEDDAGGSDEVDQLGDDAGIFASSSGFRCAAAVAAVSIPIQPPNNRHSVDERVDLEMHTQSQQHTRQNHSPAENRPKQGNHQHTEQPLRGTAGTNVGDHGVQKPETSVLQGARSVHSVRRDEGSSDEPSGDNVGEGEEGLSKGEEERWAGPGGREE